jgi:hypothetical protein
LLEKKGELAMANCEFIEECIFFNDQMTTMPSTATVYKNIYCEQDFATCGRYLVCKAIGGENVPQNFFPNQSDRAKRIITMHS